MTDVSENSAGLEVGIYANLPEREYHALPYLSNSALKLLDYDALEYWYYSSMNPAGAVQEDTFPKLLGSALHAAVFESERYASEWQRPPQPEDYPGVIRTVDDARAFLKANDHKSSGNKDLLIEWCRDIGGVLIWDDIWAEWEGKLRDGVKMLTSEMKELVDGMRERLVSNPDVMKVLTGGLSEVTLIWEEEGRRCKARLDYLRPDIIADLKTFAVKQGKSIDAVVNNCIVYERYNQQWVWYRRGLEAVKTALREGHAHVEGFSDEFIASLLDKNQGFVFIFVRSQPPHQVRIRCMRHSTSGGTPNLYFSEAAFMIERAMKKYVECLAKYGQNPWAEGEEASWLEDEEIPAIMYQSAR